MSRRSAESHQPCMEGRESEIFTVVLNDLWRVREVRGTASFFCCIEGDDTEGTILIIFYQNHKTLIIAYQEWMMAANRGDREL